MLQPWIYPQAGLSRQWV